MNNGALNLSEMSNPLGVLNSQKQKGNIEKNKTEEWGEKRKSAFLLRGMEGAGCFPWRESTDAEGKPGFLSTSGVTCMHVHLRPHVALFVVVRGSQSGNVIYRA